MCILILMDVSSPNFIESSLQLHTHSSKVHFMSVKCVHVYRDEEKKISIYWATS